jgi:PAS domain S-box-containing protein
MKTKNNKPLGNGHKPTGLVTQANLELLPLIMNNIPQAVFWKDRDLVYLGCNQAFADDAGFSSPEDVVGKTDFEMPWKAQAELYRADDSLVMEKGEPKINYEEPQTTPSGSTIWLSTSKIPVRENGKVVAVLGMYEDITARKQVETDLLLRDRALASSLNAVVILNLQDSKPIYVNDAILKMTGYTREEVMRIGLSDITGNPAAPEEIRAAIQTQGFFVGEEPIKRKDGSVFPANFFSSLITDDKGQPIAVQSTFFDITERRQAEEAVLESEERFRRFTEATVEGLVFHEQGKIMDANPAALAMFGLSNNSEFIGRNLLEFIVPESHKTVLQQMQLETVLPYEIQCIRTDGAVFPVETSTRTYQVGDRTIRASSIRDISERKRADAVVQESRARFQGLVETLSDWIWEVDQNGAYTYVSPKVTALLGYEPEEILGKTPFDLMPPEEAQRVAGVFGPLLSTQQPLVALENINRHKDGHLVVFETSGVPFFDAQKQFKGYRGTDRDITERKQADQALKENQQLLQLVMDNIPQAVFWKDKDLNFLGTNQAFAKDAGMSSPQDLIGKSDFEMPWKEQAELYRADDQQVLELGETKLNFEEPHTGPTGVTAWVRTSKIPMRDAIGNIFAVLGMYEDVTERKQAEENLRKRFEIETLLTTISSKFVTVTQENLDQNVSQSLEMLGKFAGTDRSYLFRIADDGKTMDNTHEWCADEIEAHIDNLKRVPVDTFPWLMERFNKFEVVDIPAVADMPLAAQAEKTEFQAEGIQSFIAVPIIYQNKLAGFMGFDAVSSQRTWESDTITVLRTVGETLITTIERVKLEKEVRQALERRGYEVQVSNEISQEVAAAPELNELFDRVVTLTKERLGYYHTQLLRYDATQDAVALVNGYGETGRKMLAGGHKMPLGSGLIGTAAATGETMMRSTLADDPDWQPNPLLPETKGEIAVPIKLGDQILGVLDVQSDKAGSLTEDDRLLLEGLCGQIAVAIEQTRLRQEMAERLEEVNRLYRSMSHEGWKTYRETANLPTGFVFDQTGTKPVEDIALADGSFTSVPMKVLGGETVGNLSVTNDPQRPMTQEDLVFLQQVSDQIALALEGARLSAQTQSALARSENLFEASRLLSQSADLQELVKTTVETLNIPAINRAVLTTFNYSTAGELEGMTVVANWWNGIGSEVDAVGKYYSAADLQMLPLFLSVTPLFFNDVFHDERVDPGTMQVAKALNICGAAVLPLLLGTHQLGIVLMETEEPHNFTQDEVRLYSALAPQISTVLENRRQFERAQKQAEREGMLNLISQKIQSATSVEAVLQIAARELGHALGAPMTIAQLSMKDKK